MSRKIDKLSRPILRNLAPLNAARRLRSSIKLGKKPAKHKNIKKQKLIKKSTPQLDAIWRHILSPRKIAAIKAPHMISAAQIKEARLTWQGPPSQFEPRLLCKHDCREDRPAIFAANNLSILSASMGNYVILPTSAIFFTLPAPVEPPIALRKNCGSLILQLGQSESSLIDNLRYSGLFESAQYMGEEIKYNNLFNSRHRVTFCAKVARHSIVVSGAQYEIDSVFESDNKIMIIEAKQRNNLTNFNLRQLYYPYRAIYDEVGRQKEIICLFINGWRGNTTIWRIEFSNAQEMTSAKCTSVASYIWRE